MKHDPNIARPVGSKAVAEMSDAEFDAWMAAIPPAPGIRHVDEGDDAEAKADIAAGRVYPHDIVSEWLRTWGTAGRKPFMQWLAERNGNG